MKKKKKFDLNVQIIFTLKRYFSVKCKTLFNHCIFDNMFLVVPLIQTGQEKKKVEKLAMLISVFRVAE